MPGEIWPARHAGHSFIITGGGSGIGRAAALRLAREGAQVAIADVRGELAEAVLREVETLGGRGMALQCDVGREPEVETMVAASAAAFGRIDGLFSNAGTAGRGWIHETTLDDWERVIRVNLTGAFLCSKHVLPHLLSHQSGVIVTTGSIASVVIGGGGSAASYAASKGGLLQLTRQIAVDYGSQGIRAVCLCPGAVKTNLGPHATEDRQGQAAPASGPLPRAKPWTPIPRAADADEMASAVSFLFSEDASFVTGTALFVDGGLTAI